MRNNLKLSNNNVGGRGISKSLVIATLAGLASMGSAYGTTIENADLNYIQSNYGSGNATLDFNVNNQTVKYNYKNEYGSGSNSYNYTANTHDGQNVNVNVNYTSAQTEKITNTTNSPTLPTVYRDIIMPSGGGFGGALSNSATIDNMDSFIFIHNSNRDGAGIHNTATGSIVLKNSLFVNNVSTWEGSAPEGGGIYSEGILDVYSTDFIGNTTKSMGAAISNTGTILNIKDSNFIANVSSGHSGAINNRDGGIINNIENTNFVLNYTEVNDDAGAITNGSESKINTIKSSLFLGNRAFDWGGAIRNNGGTITSIINTDFVQNKITNKGGAIFTYSSIGTISGSNFVENTSENYGGAISVSKNSSTGSIETISNSNFAYNSAGMYGGAISNEGSIGSITNSTFIENKVKSSSDTAKGGAIYTTDDLNLISDNGITEFTGNYTEANGVKDDNAIWVDSADAILTLNLKNNGKTILNDNIDGQKGYDVNISSDGTGTLYLYNDIRNADVTINGLDIQTVNNQVHNYNFDTLTLTADTNMAVDVDLANQTMDRFTASEYGSHSGNLNVVGMNLLSDAVDDNTRILFAENGLKDNVTTTVSEVAYTPIYKYNVSYDKSGEEGYFVFDRYTVNSGSSSGGSVAPEVFNPAVLGGSTSAAIGATSTMNTTFNYAFGNADSLMNLPSIERVSMKNRNKYALSPSMNYQDVERFSPLYQPSDEEASVWVKPYATFETVGLKNGPKVHNNTYGTLIGFDTEMQSLKRGWDRVLTGYIGYNGASQRYSGVDSIQNGGLIGGTVTMYKGNFFNATTLSVGANVAQNETMYGKDDFAMLLSGVGNKTGYNFEFKEGKLILQPSMLMSYTFVNTFDYTNAAGVRIDNKPLHAIQLAPGVKVIGNLKNGWQPYASVSMVWNLMGKSDATANGVKLPEMSIKPYVQYGVGVQKRIKDHFTAYGQAMIQNGGRNGISLTGGFRWALGKNKDQKVETVRNDKVSSATGKKIIKQMTPEQRMALCGKYQNTSRTAKSGNLRQL